MFLARQIFSCCADPQNSLFVGMTRDADIWIISQDRIGRGQSSDIRIRNVGCGGKDPILYFIFRAMVNDGVQVDIMQLDMFSMLSDTPKDVNSAVRYRIGCDDKPGSRANVYVHEDFVGIQTECFDQEINDRCMAGTLGVSAGPVIWLNQYQIGGRAMNALNKYLPKMGVT